MSLNLSNQEIVENTNQDEVERFESFEDYELKEELLRGIFAYGFETPSSIQQRAIQPFLDGRDLIAQSQSGTGKTGTFAISVLQKIIHEKKTQALVVSHTRELSAQIYSVFQNLSKYMALCTLTWVPA